MILAREGAQLILNGRSLERLRQVRDEVAKMGQRPWILPGDIGQRSVVAKVVKLGLDRFGRIDILINNAGGSTHGRLFDTITIKEWDQAQHANFTSAVWLCQAVIPIMKRQHYGRIVNNASLAGRHHAVLGGADYASAKAALIGLTRQLAWEFGPYGIAVNAVAASGTLTERISRRWAERPRAEQKRILESIPLRRLAQPDEVARVIAFLASDEASYVTGATLDVNGGSFMG
jgi:NAD(P)-dependent dehydrogenase (short-subunit alcohol dehydrogenase family)